MIPVRAFLSQCRSVKLAHANIGGKVRGALFVGAGLSTFGVSQAWMSSAPNSWSSSSQPTVTPLTVAPAPEALLVLHFDVNKTIIVSDPVGGKDTSTMVNSLLTECVWGRVTWDGDTPSWTCVSTKPSTQSPGDDLVTYSDFLENLLSPYQRGSGKDVHLLNASIKKARTELKCRFTLPGQVGERFRSDYEMLLQHLQIAPDNDRMVFVLPSFFRLLIRLRDTKQPFALVFRTFGTDAREVAEDLQAFTQGRHPLFVGTVLEDLDLPENAFGTFFREGKGPHGTRIVMGTLDQPQSPAEGDAFYSALEAKGEVRQIRGFDQVSQFLGELQDGSVLALRDYYPFWRDCQEADDSGKLLLVDTEQRHIRQVFFDDNVERDRPHIVDVRSATSHKPLPLGVTNDRYIVRAEPFDAITDPNYFIKALWRALDNQSHHG